MKRAPIFLFLLSLSFQLAAQEPFTCSTPDVTVEVFRELVEDVPLINEGVLPGNDSIFWTPVTFHVFLNDDGTNGYQDPTTEADISLMIDKLNEEFQDIGFYFYQLGTTNYIYNSLINNNLVPFETYFSYYSNALNIYVRRPVGAGGSVHPWDNAPNNFVSIKHIHAQVNTPYSIHTLIHETGHSFGLLHTFLAYDDFDWAVLTDPNQIDHPYTGGRPRELAIRDTVPGANFPYPNCHIGGDLVCDTPPDCRQGAQYKEAWPDSTCNSDPSSCTSGCLFSTWGGYTYIGTYEDYNEDYIEPLVDNYMSYRFDQNEFSFSDGQNLRMLFYYDTIRQFQYDTSFSINMIDSIEFEGGDLPLQNVVIQSYFPNDTLNYFTATSDTVGWFQGIAYDTSFSANVFKMGSGEELKYSYDDWRQGVSTLDLVILRKHILKLDTLNGYRQIAADVNASGTVTTYDGAFMSRLILGIDTTFANHPGPWRFIPEYIPATEETQFHEDPFNMKIGETSYTNEAPYIDSSWVFSISNGLNGTSGFDGVKLGDLNGSSMEDETPVDSLTISFENPTLLLDSIYLFEFELTATDSIVGWQVGYSYDVNYLEFLEIDTSGIDAYTPTFNVDGVKGEIRINWYDENLDGLDCTNGRVMFGIKFKSLDNFSDLSEYFKPDRSLLRNEAYSTDFEITDGSIKLEASQFLENRSLSKEPIPNTEPDILIFPNPTRGDLTLIIRSETDQVVDIQAIDIFGKQSYLGNLELREGTGTYRMTLSPGLNDGNYLLRFDGPFLKKTIRVSLIR